MNYLNTVEQFHILFDQVILPHPAIPSADRIKLRLGLCQEELNELEEAYAAQDVVAMADALADLMYVVCGTILESGLKDKFDRIFAEVHRSNMSKACATIDEAFDTQKSYGVECYNKTKVIDGIEVFFVIRASDDKLLKSINYSAANIQDIIYEPIQAV